LGPGGIRPPAIAAGDDRGFTLVETLVGLLLAVVIAGGAMAMVSFATSTQPKTTKRAAQLQQGRAMIEQITRELRQGESVTGAGATGLQVLTSVNNATCGGAYAVTAITCRVIYDCSSTSCRRTVKNPDGTGSGTAKTLVTGISSANVFTYSPSATNPTYVGVQLVYPSTSAADGEAVTLSDGVAVRNWFEEG
jgi:prepilin-type N-terminal cleavage/methylation domain-containing protein